MPEFDAAGGHVGTPRRDSARAAGSASVPSLSGPHDAANAKVSRRPWSTASRTAPTSGADVRAGQSKGRSSQRSWVTAAVSPRPGSREVEGRNHQSTDLHG